MIMATSTITALTIIIITKLPTVLTTTLMITTSTPQPLFPSQPKQDVQRPRPRPRDPGEGRRYYEAAARGSLLLRRPVPLSAAAGDTAACAHDLGFVRVSGCLWVVWVVGVYLRVLCGRSVVW